MSQKTSVFNLEQLMDYLGSETFVGVTSAGYEPYKDQSGELRDTERFLLLDDKGFVWSLWVYETEEGFGARQPIPRVIWLNMACSSRKVRPWRFRYIGNPVGCWKRRNWYTVW